MPITFAVDEVKSQKLPPWTLPVPLAECSLVQQSKVNQKPEAFGGPAKIAISPTSNRQGLVDAVHYAYDNHCPLQLTPESIWLTIQRGVAIHVEQNAEKLRKKLVTFEGQEKLTVCRDTFRRGSPDNDWQGVFNEFGHQIRERTVPGTYEKMVCDFSTTGLLDRAISSLTLMSTLDRFFAYEVNTKCGIPQITLTGTVEDWERILQKAVALRDLDLDWWLEALIPVLNQFVVAAQGDPQVDFWQNFYKVVRMSGGDSITGHINCLFPYIEGTDWRDLDAPVLRYWARKRESHAAGPTQPWKSMHASGIPSGILVVPFVWKYLGEKLDMQFRGGLGGYTIDPETNLVTPASLWTVNDAPRFSTLPPSKAAPKRRKQRTTKV